MDDSADILWRKQDGLPYKLREMEDNPVLERMTQAYDADYVVQSE